MNVRQAIAYAFHGKPIAYEGEAVQQKYELQKDPAFLDLQKMVKGIGTIIQQQTSALNSLNTAVTALKPVGGTGNGGGGNDDDNKDDDQDVDKMTQKDFMQFMLGKVGELLEKNSKDILTKVDGLGRAVRTKEVQAEVNEFKKTHPDFNEWEQELTDLAKTHPTLNVADLYMLAKSRFPDKATEMDAKYKPKDENVDDGGLTLFGGFRPSTSKDAGGGEGKETKKLTLDEALNKSWDSVVSKFPALGKMEDVLD